METNERFLTDLYNFIFQWFDTETNWTGDQSGEIATKIEQLTKKLLEELEA